MDFAVECLSLFREVHRRNPRQSGSYVRMSTSSGISAEIGTAEREGGPGAWIELTAEFEGLSGGMATMATFVGLGARGKPAERVADEAVDELLGMLAGEGAVDAHTADQLLLPLSFAEGRSAYTVGEVTEHLRTNIGTIRAFMEREIRVEEGEGGAGRVVMG